MLIAPEFAPDALELLKKKKNRRLRALASRPHAARRADDAGVANGLLVQDADRPGNELDTAKLVTKRQPTPASWRRSDFGWKVVKHVKSNAIVFAAENRTLAVGGGQTSRVEAIRNAVARAAREKIALAGLRRSRATRSSRSPTVWKRPRTRARPRSCSPVGRRATPR